MQCMQGLGAGVRRWKGGAGWFLAAVLTKAMMSTPQKWPSHSVVVTHCLQAPLLVLLYNKFKGLWWHSSQSLWSCLCVQCTACEE